MAWCRGSSWLGALLLSSPFWLGACDEGTEDPDAGKPAKDGGEADAEAPHEPVDASPKDAGTSSDAAPIEVVCDVTPPTSCPTPPVRYGDITPILEARCLSCHDGKGEQWPLTSYSHVTGWFNEIRSAMTDCSMPPADAGIEVPTAEREKILEWLICGMPR